MVLRAWRSRASCNGAQALPLAISSRQAGDPLTPMPARMFRQHDGRGGGDRPSPDCNSQCAYCQSVGVHRIAADTHWQSRSVRAQTGSWRLASCTPGDDRDRFRRYALALAFSRFSRQPLWSGSGGGAGLGDERATNRWSCHGVFADVIRELVVARRRRTIPPLHQVLVIGRPVVDPHIRIQTIDAVFMITASQRWHPCHSQSTGTPGRAACARLQVCRPTAAIRRALQRRARPNGRCHQ